MASGGAHFQKKKREADLVHVGNCTVGLRVALVICILKGDKKRIPGLGGGGVTIVGICDPFYNLVRESQKKKV